MNEVSPFRLNVLRALYLLVVVGLGLNVWPGIFHHEKWEFFEGIVTCMLAAFSLLCLVGLRYPLQLLPVLMWEVVWKTLWFGLVALPQWRAGHIDESIVPNIYACSLIVLYYLGLPWSYIVAHYLKKPGEQWRKAAGAPVAEAAR